MPCHFLGRMISFHQHQHAIMSKKMYCLTAANIVFSLSKMKHKGIVQSLFVWKKKNLIFFVLLKQDRVSG